MSYINASIILALFQSLLAMAAEHDGRVVCPRTKEIFNWEDAEKVFVMWCVTWGVTWDVFSTTNGRRCCTAHYRNVICSHHMIIDLVLGAIDYLKLLGYLVLYRGCDYNTKRRQSVVSTRHPSEIFMSPVWNISRFYFATTSQRWWIIWEIVFWFRFKGALMFVFFVASVVDWRIDRRIWRIVLPPPPTYFLESLHRHYSAPLLLTIFSYSCQ